MGRKRYNKDFQESAAKLVLEQGYTAQKAAESLGVHLTTVKGWVLDYRSEHGTPKSLEQVDQRKYVEQLERENRQLRMEREILKKATAFFAKEQL
jgi:transposase